MRLQEHSAIENIAKNYVDYNEKYPPIIDPMLIILIVTIVSEIIQLLIACKKQPDDAETIFKRPTSLEQKYLRRVVRKNMGVWYPFKGLKMMRAIRRTGRKLKNHEVHELFDCL